MKSLTIGLTLLLVIISFPPLQAEERATQEQTLKSPMTTSKHTKQYSSQPLNPTQRSRKCAIYSGVCPMGSMAKVGDYCICHTPSGPIHGVVIP
ncbi:MAG: hypothetical protein KME56_14155 [Candidatus Thiodiazotropha sp. (ex Ctena orbiculata)]|uniref:Uncharacterized protein n=1 Tax=Candidatus Thiodiazotropha taylori TaxID=2792791 RepID=A0A944QW71_9GAMM|nr:hypothetical protein [Candidatus Thiodiazotropha taylori]MBT2990800.1 hypothetical protein [Candidatus Thiodiazotropha taylori]MBT2997750.1 hypothetical protein [Candidatus Thiodiazotropha taylori]MBT3000481.1 hypothetical protein [Candidatus Thiodiazotropha taylori]MBT3027485.1 hypothetical protein [Candidatus Thiodiazotropha taylori]